MLLLGAMNSTFTVTVSVMLVIRDSSKAKGSFLVNSKVGGKSPTLCEVICTTTSTLQTPTCTLTIMYMQEAKVNEYNN